MSMYHGCFENYHHTLVHCCLKSTCFEVLIFVLFSLRFFVHLCCVLRVCIVFILFFVIIFAGLAVTPPQGTRWETALLAEMAACYNDNSKCVT